MNAYLTPVGHALGDLEESLAEAAARGTLRSDPELLAEAGFHTHHVASPRVDAYELARQACRGLGAGADVIIYATALPGCAARDRSQQFRETGDVRWLMDYAGSRLQAELGSDAAVIGIGQQACTGALGAIRIARSLIVAGECDSALCVTADRFPDGAIYEQAFNLISDGAAACLVTREPGPFLVRGTAHITEGGFATASDDETVGTYFSHTVEVVRRACAGAQTARWLVTQNTHANANRLLGSLLGIEASRVYCPSRAEVGHVISADNLLNLERLAGSGELVRGETVALPMAGYGANWQCVVLESV